LTNSPRSVIRGVRDAFSAKAGVLSALLAKEGVTGFGQPLEGRAGLFTMYSKGKYDPLVLTKELGSTFEGANVSFKPWPSCRGTHNFIQATLQIVEEYRIKPREIKEIKLIVSPASLSRMLCEPIERKRNPATAIDAKFSIPFTVAVALVYQNVSLDHFTPQALLDENVLDITRRILYEVNPELDSNQGFVQIKTGHGEISSKKIDHIYGHRKNPISQDALVSKFMDCARYSTKKISQKDLNRVVQLILHLEDVKDMGEIVGCLSSQAVC
jgi:2-methylcitrate dehydratase PrpD